MKTVRELSRVPRVPRPVVAIGIFDGMHVGHTAIIKSCVRVARRRRGTAVVLTFDPHPQNELSIYSLDHRLAIMERLGIDLCILARFTKAFSRLTPAEFVDRVICGRIRATQVMVGENFAFGRGLSGDVSTLRVLGASRGFATRVFPIRRMGGAPVSSTRIRACIREGRLREAARMLGREVSVMGTVVGGRRVGRLLGYPTANVRPRHEVLPPDGIYAVKARVDGRWVPGICYKGRRPTFGAGATSIEVHLFRFAGDLYGSTMEVRFYALLRGEKKFASPAELRAAIARDIARAKKLLKLP